MVLEDITLNETLQPERDKHSMLSIICGIQRIQQTSDLAKKEADPQIQRAS